MAKQLILGGRIDRGELSKSVTGLGAIKLANGIHHDFRSIDCARFQDRCAFGRVSRFA
jgi:hypothetical protein